MGSHSDEHCWPSTVQEEYSCTLHGADSGFGSQPHQQAGAVLPVRHAHVRVKSHCLIVGSKQQSSSTNTPTAPQQVLTYSIRLRVTPSVKVSFNVQCQPTDELN